MANTAKLFMNGRSQAVRLPASFRFDCEEVYIRKDKKTGDVIISKKPDTWDDFFEIIDDIDVPASFMAERGNTIEVDKDLF